MKRKLVMLCVAVLIVIGVITAVLMFIDNMVKKRTTWHTFEVGNVPRFLTEEMVIGFGRKALAKDGSDEAAWEPQKDGNTDKYIDKNEVHPTRAYFVW